MFKSKRKGKKKDAAQQRGSDDNQQQPPPTPPTRTRREEVAAAAILLTPPASKRTSSTTPVPSSAPPRLSGQRGNHDEDEEEDVPPASLHRRLFRLRIGSAFKRLAPPSTTPTSTPIKGQENKVLFASLAPPLPLLSPLAAMDEEREEETKEERAQAHVEEEAEAAAADQKGEEEPVALPVQALVALSPSRPTETSSSSSLSVSSSLRAFPPRGGGPRFLSREAMLQAELYRARRQLEEERSKTKQAIQGEVACRREAERFGAALQQLQGLPHVLACLSAAAAAAAGEEAVRAALVKAVAAEIPELMDVDQARLFVVVEGGREGKGGCFGRLGVIVSRWRHRFRRDWWGRRPLLVV